MQASRYFSERHRQSFERDGFLMVKQIFDPQYMGRVRAWVDEVQARPEMPGKDMEYFEDSISGPARRLLDRIENIVPYHEGLAEVINGEALLGRVSELMGERAVLFKEKIIFKLPNSRGFEPHQDMQAGWDAYASLFVTALVAVDPASAENGCLEIVSGQNRRGLIGEKWRPLQENELSGMKFLPCLLEPGDVVFFDSFTPHRSAPNLSPWPRRALYATYNRRSEGDHRTRYFADKRKSYPPDCEREPNKRYEYKV